MVAESNDRPAAMVPRAEGETSVSAVASQAVANVQARFAIAQKVPRQIDTVRVKLLKECQRPRFCEVALYNKPIGEGIVGPSIRFAEAALRCMGNMMPSATILYDDAQKRVMRVAVTDLENNLTYEKDVTFAKTVERHHCPRGTLPLGTRLNSRGKTVYILPATDDDILNKENALVSKALRTLALRHLPGDILDECLELVSNTLNDAAAKDPDAERKKVCDGFALLNIMPHDLIAYLGHSLEKTTPAELTKLRALYGALRDGETNWAEVMDSKAAEQGAKKDGTTKTSRTKAKLDERRKGGAKGKPAAAPQEDAAPAAPAADTTAPQPATPAAQEGDRGE